MGLTALMLAEQAAERAKIAPPRPPSLEEMPRTELEALARKQRETIHRLERENAELKAAKEHPPSKRR
jgi:hypothetical protein